MINAHFKLGKLPAKHDVRTLHLENYIFPEPPEQRIWSDKVSGYEMLGNDEAGNCGPCGLLHSVQTMTANASTEQRFSTKQSLQVYTRLTGYNPKTGRPDPGIVMLEMLKVWKNEGFFGHKIGAFMSVNSRNLRMVRVAMNEFCGTIIGLALPISAQNKTRWDIEGSFNGDGAPGSWGLHCTYKPDYLKNGDFNHVTWGDLMPSSDKFNMVYTDEEYVLLSRDFVNDKNLCPSNFDWDKMTFDLNHVQ